MKNDLSIDAMLLPDYQKWKSDFENPQLTLWDYINFRGDFELAAAFCTLFRPAFIKVEECTLLEVGYDKQSFERWKQEFGGDREKIELTMNHVHVYDLFTNCRTEDIDTEVFEYIGQTLLKCWKATIHEAFPDEQFNFIYSAEPNEYGPTITFSRKA